MKLGNLKTKSGVNLNNNGIWELSLIEEITIVILGFTNLATSCATTPPKLTPIIPKGSVI